MTGTILRVILPRGFGFVAGEDGQEYFLHAKSLPEGDWDGDKIRKGARVEFTPSSTKEGLRATEARLL